MPVRVIFFEKKLYRELIHKQKSYSRYKFHSFHSSNSLELTEFYKNAQCVKRKMLFRCSFVINVNFSFNG